MQVTSLPLSREIQKYMGDKYKIGNYCYDSIGRLLLVTDARDNRAIKMLKVAYVGMTVPGDNIGFIRREDCAPAYTLAELLERLPAVIIKGKERWWLHVDKVGAHYLNDKFQALKGRLTDHKTSLTEAAGQLLFFCGENGHLQEGKDDLLPKER